MDPEEQLTPKQAEFVRLFLQSANATQAYMRAFGETNEATAASNASHLTRNHKVAQQIAKHQKLLDQAAQVTAEQILIRTADLAANAPKVSDRLRALDMLAKMRGMYSQTLQLEGATGLIINVFPAPLNPEEAENAHE
jgi:phage terminase small subunit